VKRIFVMAVSLSSLLAACQKPAPATPEPVAKNAVTDYVDRGHVALDKAQNLAEQTNTRIQQQDQQAQAFDAIP